MSRAPGTVAIAVLRGGFYLLGVSAILIGSSNFLFGIATTADIVALLIAPSNTPDRFADLATANTDNEFRFYAVFWVAYGVLLVRAARGLPATLNRAPLLIALFLIGGIGRLLSIAAHGPPDPLFMRLMYVEFVACAVFAIAWLVARRG